MLDVAAEPLDAIEIVPLNVRRILVARFAISSILYFRFVRLNPMLFLLFLKKSQWA